MLSKNTAVPVLRRSDSSPTLDPKLARTKVADWSRRLRRLYAQLDEWLKSLPNATASHSETSQVVDPLMRRLKVPSHPVPTYTVFVDQQPRAAFVPSATWI